jgi:hypothetical protein
MPGFTQLRSQRTTGQDTLLDSVAPQASTFWRIDLGYTLIWSALLLWACLNPGSFWFSNTAAVSPASQVMCACALVTPFFIPFVVYFPIFQTKGHFISFASAQLPSSKTTPGYLQQVVACSLLTLIPLLSVYVLFVLMNWQGFLGNDPITPIILGPTLLIFVLALTLLTSASAIGLAMSGSRALHLLAMAIAVSTVTLPFILSELVTGSRFESYLVRVVKGVGVSAASSILLLLSSLVVGGSFAWLYGRKHH